MSDCVFCVRITAGECEQTEVNSVVMFAPLNPVTPGHMLFVSRAHVVSAAASPWRAGNACLAAASYVAREQIEANIITSIGAVATQTVPHLHVHVVPRHEGDGLALPWTGQAV